MTKLVRPLYHRRCSSQAAPYVVVPVEPVEQHVEQTVEQPVEQPVEQQAKRKSNQKSNKIV